MYSTIMRDSTKDYRTYWLQDGLYYSRRKNLGEAPACDLPADKLAQIPADDRQIVVEEANADPAFCRLLMHMMATDSDWAHKIAASANAAASSELDPKRKGTVKSWPKLRQRVHGLLVEVAAAARTKALELTPAERLNYVKRLATGEIHVPKSMNGLAGLGDLGQWDIIGNLVGSLVQAGAGIYGGVVTADAQKDIAKIQANTAMQSAQAQMAIANANAAIANAQAQMSPISAAVSSLTSSTVAGVPVIIPVAGVIAFAAWYFWGRKR